MSNISNRFDQPSIHLYPVESIVIDAANGRSVNAETFALITERYEGDFDARRLGTQLGMLHEVFRIKGEIRNLADVVNGLTELGEAKFILYSEVNIVLQLLLTVPASSATTDELKLTFHNYQTSQELSQNYIDCRQTE